jgi:hypothetical protein
MNMTLDITVGLTAIPLLKFNELDAAIAFEQWHCNCGPGALAAATGHTLEEIHPHLVGFDQKHYTNPTMMFGALRSLAVPFARLHIEKWPIRGLIRVQWHGPWMRPGVPMRARYRQTHWIAAFTVNGGHGVFDINCPGHLITRDDWAAKLAPGLIRDCCPKGDGAFSFTHAVELENAK